MVRENNAKFNLALDQIRKAQNCNGQTTPKNIQTKTSGSKKKSLSTPKSPQTPQIFNNTTMETKNLNQKHFPDTLPLQSTVVEDSAKMNNNHNNKPNPSVSQNEKMNICESLLESEWVSDDAVQIYYDLLNNAFQNDKFYFVSPVITIAIKTLEDYREIIQPICLQNKDFIFFPVNNSPEIQNIGGSGSHWSLLVFDKKQKNFYHFDSGSDLNLEHAKKISKRISTYLDPTTVFPLIKGLTPQQNNSIDCGVYMLLVTDAIVSALTGEVFALHPEILTQALAPPTEWEILTKRAQLALIIHKNRYLSLSKSAIQELIISKFSNKILQDNYDKILLKNQELVSEIYKLTHNTTDLLKNQVQHKSHKNHSENKWTLAVSRRNKNNNGTNLKKLPQLQKTAISTSNNYQILCNHDLQQTIEKKTFNLQETKNQTKFKNKIIQSRPKITFGKKIKLAVYSDSQGHEVAQGIERANQNEIKAVGCVMPNARLLQVTEAALSSTDDAIVLLGGTNDVLQSDVSSIYKSLESDLITLSKNKPVIIATVPRRYDQDIFSPVHNTIDLLNNYIRELVFRIKSTYLIDLDRLKRFHFTRHGLHLSGRGRTKLGYLIMDILKNVFPEKEQQSLEVHIGDLKGVMANTHSTGKSHNQVESSNSL
ncbi:SUMO1 sentrin specific peptidase 8 [Homalodisca vitripennis]|nr:SUMO1 sentrin specific peptidase 8 [Homalodisca vitripennis]